MSDSKSLQDVHDRHYDGLKLGYMRTSTVNGEVDIYVGSIFNPHNNLKELFYEGLLDSVRKVDNFPKPKSIANTVVFKMRHKPSGLFATSADSKYTDFSCTKLSVDGKVYSRKPKLPDSSFKVVYPKSLTCIMSDVRETTQPSEWEIVTYELKEIK